MRELVLPMCPHCSTRVHQFRKERFSPEVCYMLWLLSLSLNFNQMSRHAENTDRYAVIRLKFSQEGRTLGHATLSTAGWHPTELGGVEEGGAWSPKQPDGASGWGSDQKGFKL